MNNKLKLLFIHPGPISRPNMKDFKDRFEMLSEYYEGEVYSCSRKEEYKELKMASFQYKGMLPKDLNVPYSKLAMAKHVIKCANAYYKNHGVDVIICYDAVFTGVIGSYLKKKFKCKLIIELNNSDLSKSMALSSAPGLKTKIKIRIATFLKHYSLKHADVIKLLTESQKENLETKYLHKSIHCFHDFVPTNYFVNTNKQTNNVILFVGFPFYLKGVDVLVKAFEKIADNYPDFELHLIGHLLEDNATKYLGTWHERVKFIKPMYYDELRDHFISCHCFILPSRAEGMGRVLIEAMACEKPLIGSNVGGIPSLIKNGENGFLFESENIEDLSQKIDALLSDKQLAKNMGQKGKQIMDENYSDIKYLHYFKQMIDGLSLGRG